MLSGSWGSTTRPTRRSPTPSRGGQQGRGCAEVHSQGGVLQGGGRARGPAGERPQRDRELGRRRGGGHGLRHRAAPHPANPDQGDPLPRGASEEAEVPRQKTVCDPAPGGGHQ